MIEFQKLNEKDFEKINKYLLLDETRSCEKIGAALMMWRNFYGIEWSVFDETLIIKYKTDDGVAYLTPIGKNPRGAVKALSPAHFIGVCNEDVEKVALDGATVEKDRNNFDYIYKASDLRTFSGKKLHAKKNFLNRFKKTYSYEYVADPPKEELDEFFRLIDKKQPHYDETGRAELDETIDVIDHRELFHVHTGAVKVDGKIIAACAASIVRDTMYVHIEKADREYPGSYQAIVSEFAKSFPDVEYINREDDLGEEGLRQSKLSYQPIYLLEKNRIINP